jgi:hypothetical protein
MRRVSFWYLAGFIFGPAGIVLVPAGSRADPAGRAEIEARATAQGEQALKVGGTFELDPIEARFGVESLGGARAPLRHAASGAFAVSIDGWSIEGEARASPPQAEADALAGTLGLRRELEGAAATLSIGARRSDWLPCDACAVQTLAGAGASIEGELAIAPGWRVDARAAAWALQLRGADRARPSAWTPGPWDRFGASTLDWPERWELGGTIRRSWTAIAGALGASIGAPPADGAIAARATAKLEASLGPGTAVLSAAVARLWPSGQLLGELALSIGVRLGGVP